jgi:hypothetical protein
VLAAGRSTDGSYLFATTHALHHVPPTSTTGSPAAATGEGLAWRLPYEDILRAVWDEETASLRVWEPSLPAGSVEIPLAKPDRLPETVRERVTSTLIVSQHVPLRGRRGVWLTARRRPGDTETRWTMVFDAGLDVSDSNLRTRAAAALEDLRQSTGV